jgi:hypothetical protein
MSKTSRFFFKIRFSGGKRELRELALTQCGSLCVSGTLRVKINDFVKKAKKN